MDKPPPGYVPGISRGDTGFITRLDVGPMDIDPRLNNLKTTNNYRNSSQHKAAVSDEVPIAKKFDEWSGYSFSMNIFRSSKYTADDRGNFQFYLFIYRLL